MRRVMLGIAVLLAAAATAMAAALRFTLHRARPDGADAIAPDTMATGPDGALWFTERAPLGVGRLDPRTGAVRSYRIPDAAAIGELGGLSGGPGPYIWVAAGGAIDRLTPATGRVRSFRLPAGSEPRALTRGPDGAVWFTDGGHGAIGRLLPRTGRVVEYREPGGQPDGIVAGPHGGLWFTDGTGRVGRIDLRGRIVSYPLPAAGCRHGSGPRAWAITVGPDRNLWFTTYATDQIGSLDPATGRIRLMLCVAAASRRAYYLLTPASASELAIGIASGPGRRLWFTTESGSDTLGAVAPGSGQVTRYQLPDGRNAGGAGIALGPGGRLWVTLPRARRLAQVRP